MRRRDAVDREERADVGERQREDRVLDLDQAGEEPRLADSGVVGGRRSRVDVVGGGLLVGEQLQRVR